MKKKLVLLVLVLVVALMAFAGCASDKFYQRNVTNFEDLKVSMGDSMVYPTFELKGENKFYNPADFKGAVTIPAEARYNEIILLYLPPLTQAEGDALIDGPVAFDTKAYRYSVKLTLGKDYGTAFEKGTIELYAHGTDFSKVKDAKDTEKIVMVSVEDRKAKLDKDNAGDKKKLDKNGESSYFLSEIDTTTYAEPVYKYANKMDSQVIRYFNVGTGYSYELTACIRLNGDVKGDAVKPAYDALLAEAEKYLDGFVATMLA